MFKFLPNFLPRLFCFITLLFVSTNLWAFNLGLDSLIFKQGELHGYIKVLRPIQIGENSPFKISFTERSLRPTTISDKITVTLWMPVMNHGSAPTKVTKIPDEVGSYKVDRVYYTMGGLWEVIVQLTDEFGITETQSFEIYLRDDRDYDDLEHI